jgi:hypothetical protein
LAWPAATLAVEPALALALPPVLLHAARPRAVIAISAVPMIRLLDLNICVTSV